jgi:small-conductance mechanosensitive channel
MVYEVRAASPERPAARRAHALELALGRVAHEPRGEAVTMQLREGRALLYAGPVLLLELFPEDAAAHGESSLLVHAERVVTSLETALRAERERKSWAERVFSVSLVVLLTLVALALLGRTGDLAGRWRAWLESQSSRVPALRVQSLELLGAGAVRSAGVIGIELGKWLLRLFIVYAWLLLCLAQFEATQGAVDGLTGRLLRPLGAALQRFALSVPLLGVTLLAALAVAALLRFSSLLFDGVARGEAQLSWVRAEHARALDQLVRLLVVLGATLFLWPLLTGNADGVMPRLGLLGLASLALAAAPLLASLLVGAGTVFGGQLRLGDDVSFGGRRGRVVETTLLSVRLRTDAGSTVRVPQLLALLHPTEHFAGHGESVELSLPHATRSALDAAERAARTFDPDASAELVSLSGRAGVLRVRLPRLHLDARLRSAVLLALSEALAAAEGERA